MSMPVAGDHDDYGIIKALFPFKLQNKRLDYGF